MVGFLVVFQAVPPESGYSIQDFNATRSCPITLAGVPGGHPTEVLTPTPSTGMVLAVAVAVRTEVGGRGPRMEDRLEAQLEQQHLLRRMAAIGLRIHRRLPLVSRRHVLIQVWELAHNGNGNPIRTWKLFLRAR